MWIGMCLPLQTLGCGWEPQKGLAETQDGAQFCLWEKAPGRGHLGLWAALAPGFYQGTGPHTS